VVVGLNTGVEFGFPAKLAEGLSGASPESLSEIEISPAGLGLHWPRLDADLNVGQQPWLFVGKVVGPLFKGRN